jgi:hypothetical protein
MKKLLVGVVLGAILASAGIAVASIPDSSGVIHGCYKNTGNVKELIVIDDAAQNCPSGYVALNWNQEGPSGPTGPTAPTATYGVRANALATNTAGYSNPVVAMCVQGDFATGGSYLIAPGSDGDLALIHPFEAKYVDSNGNDITNPGVPPAGFRAQVWAESGTQTYVLGVQVVCVHYE